MSQRKSSDPIAPPLAGKNAGARRGKEFTTKLKRVLKELSAKELQFIDEYLANGGNGTQAYRQVYPRAGYNTARNGAKDILAKPYIQEALKTARIDFNRAHRVKHQRILNELLKIATSDIGQVFEFTKEGPVFRPGHQIPPSARQAIASIEVVPIVTIAAKTKGKRPANSIKQFKVKVRFHDKIQALDRLSRHLGLYDELPPLERVLNELPTKIADEIRQAVREQVEAATSTAPVNRRDKPDAGDPVGRGDVPGFEDGSRPVASKLPPELYEASNGARVSSGGEEFCGGDEDPEPLFGDA